MRGLTGGEDIGTRRERHLGDDIVESGGVAGDVGGHARILPLASPAPGPREADLIGQHSDRLGP
jgi:hypothetical protein